MRRLWRDGIRRLVGETLDTLGQLRGRDLDGVLEAQVGAFVEGQVDRLPALYRRPVKLLLALEVVLSLATGHRSSGLSPLCRLLPGHYLLGRLVHSLAFLRLFDLLPTADGTPDVEPLEAQR